MDFIEQAEWAMVEYSGYDLTSFEIVSVGYNDIDRWFNCTVRDARGEKFPIPLVDGGLIMPTRR